RPMTLGQGPGPSCAAACREAARPTRAAAVVRPPPEDKYLPSCRACRPRALAAAWPRSCCRAPARPRRRPGPAPSGGEGRNPPAPAGAPPTRGRTPRAAGPPGGAQAREAGGREGARRRRRRRRRRGARARRNSTGGGGRRRLWQCADGGRARAVAACRSSQAAQHRWRCERRVAGMPLLHLLLLVILLLLFDRQASIDWARSAG
ncbi:unnamed protein product, partial [Prorocentrum cordatum]